MCLSLGSGVNTVKPKSTKFQCAVADLCAVVFIEKLQAEVCGSDSVSGWEVKINII